MCFALHTLNRFRNFWEWLEDGQIRFYVEVDDLNDTASKTISVPIYMQGVVEFNPKQLVLMD